MRISPSQEPYKGILPLSKLICSKEDYLDRRDTKKEKNFYALWPEDTTIRDSVPQPPENLDPPDDTFANLHTLDFYKPGYQGVGTQRPASPTPMTDEDPPANEPRSRQPKIDLDALDFGLELNDE